MKWVKVGSGGSSNKQNIFIFYSLWRDPIQHMSLRREKFSGTLHFSFRGYELPKQIIYWERLDLWRVKCGCLHQWPCEENQLFCDAVDQFLGFCAAVGRDWVCLFVSWGLSLGLEWIPPPLRAARAVQHIHGTNLSQGFRNHSHLGCTAQWREYLLYLCEGSFLPWWETWFCLQSRIH